MPSYNSSPRQNKSIGVRKAKKKKSPRKRFHWASPLLHKVLLLGGGRDEPDLRCKDSRRHRCRWSNLALSNSSTLPRWRARYLKRYTSPLRREGHLRGTRPSRNLRHQKRGRNAKQREEGRQDDPTRKDKKQSSSYI